MAVTEIKPGLPLAVDAGSATGEARRGGAALFGRLVLAACALPGVMPGVIPGVGAGSAHAEEAPEQGVIAFKFSGYSEGQATVGTGSGGGENETERSRSNSAANRAQALATTSGASGGVGGGDARMGVSSPSLYLLLPLGRQWSAESSLTVDTVSGASPKYYSDMSGASHMEDRRVAVDGKLTRYFERQSLSLGLSRSKEHDYLSRALSLEGRAASADQNTTWNLGLGLTNDDINPSNAKVSPQTRQTRELQVGVTQAVNARDLMQASFTLSRAQGYLNDPYKLYDERPRERQARILQLRWNHWLGGSALKLGYRLYRDSYQVSAHTFDLAWALPVGSSTTFTPSLRYHTQRAASFYFDPSSDASVYPAPVGNPTYFSNDQRLAAWGALSLGGKIEWRLGPSWTTDVKGEIYQQRAGWRLGGQGSPGLQTLTAFIWQVGLSHSF